MMPFGNAQSAATQFTTWVNEVENFKERTKQADSERKTTDEELKTLRYTQKNFNSKMHVASDERGQIDSNCVLLKNEKERLQKQLQHERHQLEESARKTDELLEMEKADKKGFSKEMEALNNELFSLLNLQNDMRLQGMLNEDSVATLDTLYKNLQNDAATTAFETASTTWKTAKDKFNKTMEEHKILTSKYHGHRKFALDSGNPNLNEDTLPQLEREWAGSANPSDPVHLQLFYGSADQA